MIPLADGGQRIRTVAGLLDAIEQRPDLAVEADLTVAVAGRELRVVGYDDLVVVDVPSVRAALALARRYRARTMDAAAALDSMGLTVEAQVRGVPVGRVGAAATPGTAARLLGLGPVELVPEGVALALTRRRG